MELEVHRQERILAPIQLVWEEMDSLDQILSKAPQISEYEVVPGGQRARARTRLAWGPVKWTLDIEAEIIDFVPLQRIGYSVDGAALEVRHEATVELTPVGENETKLEYRGHLDVRHRMAGRMRGLFNEVAEDHAHSFIHRVKVKAEQRRLAQERLLK
ncbi:MAG: SRPBCC family protein [Actinomycetota bacterium]|jgi:carbon monoxide dehydrogenase subunit G